MTIVLTFIFNAGLNLVVGLAVAGVLGPVEYGRFAVASMLAIVLGTALFEWLRLSATRYIAEPGSRHTRVASLEAGYVAIAVLLIGAALAAPAAGLGPGVIEIPIALVALVATLNARFEMRGAEARALFMDRVYLRIVIAKNVLALVLMIGAAALLGSADWVLVMLGVSTAVACLFVRDPPGETRLSLSRARGADLMLFARYGFPIVGANLVYQVILLVNRSVGAHELGLADAGRLALATDLTIRLLLSIGAALDAFLFQLAVRRRTEEGEEAGRRQLADNMLVVAGVLVFLGVGYAMAMPAIEALFVPEPYHGSFGTIGTILIPGVIAFCFVQFGLNPIFQLAGRTTALLWTALAALALDLALLHLLVPFLGLPGIAIAHGAALVAGGLAAFVPALRMRPLWPARREILAVVLAGAAMALAMWPLRALPSPWLALAAAGGAGTLAYAAVLVGLDVLGLRRRLGGILRPGVGAPPAASPRPELP